jgi:hypothetical protein
MAIAAACTSAFSFSSSCADHQDDPSSDDQVRVKLPANVSGAPSRGDQIGQCVAAEDGGDASSVDPAMGCKVDDDCVRIEKGCCHLGKFIAVTKALSAGYQATLQCVGVVCPQIMIADDHSVAQCNVETHQCEVVLPKDIACDGFTTNPHTCPSGWRCRRQGHIADLPGSCVQLCGGVAGIQCSDPSAQCVDDPDDTCDPNNGGADCGGLCLPGTP